MTSRAGAWTPKGVLGLVIAAGLAVALAAGLASLFPGRTRPELDRIKSVPPFSLVTASGDSITLADLEGEIWVAGFLFTRCTGICPRIAQSMRELQERLDPDLPWRLVAFTVDPAYDTPEVLRAYAAAHGADPERWTFVTGRKRDLWKLIGDGFLLTVQESGPGATELITHTSRMALVDGEGTIRGYYDALLDDEMDDLVRDVKRLGS